MTAFSLSPGFVLIKTETSGRPHVMTLPVHPIGEIVPGSLPILQNRAEGLALNTFVDEFTEVLAPLLTDETAITSAELWWKVDADADPMFIYAVTPAHTAGTQTIALQPYSQAVFSFRTSFGHLLKIYVMEGFLGVNQVYPPPLYGGNTELAAFSSYILSDASCIVGRDGTYPIAAIRCTTKTNDALRKKYITR